MTNRPDLNAALDEACFNGIVFVCGLIVILGVPMMIAAVVDYLLRTYH